MAAVTVQFVGAQKNKFWHCFHCFPNYFPWSDGTRCHDLNFSILSFKLAFPLSSFTFNNRLFRSSSLSAIRLVSSACISQVIDIYPGNLDSSLWFIQPSISHDVLCIEVKYAGWQYTGLFQPFPSFESVSCATSSCNCCFLLHVHMSINVYIDFSSLLVYVYVSIYKWTQREEWTDYLERSRT